ncbi:MAG: radical SAM protein [Chloroflexi bacterium]|nr:radical SAM protein [Chloroflexota bacterium]
MSGRIITLVNPPSAPGTTANREGAAGLGTVVPGEGAFAYPPQTIATMVTMLKAEGFEVRVVDAVAGGLDIKRACAQSVVCDPAVVGVFTSYATRQIDAAFLVALREMCSVPLVAFGPATRFLVEQLVADAVLCGEPELAIAPLCRVLLGGNPPRGTIWPHNLGLCGYDNGGLIEDLGALPRPSWDCVPWRDYGFLTITGSRGCPDPCAYCPYSVAGGHCIRVRLPEDIAEEMAWIERDFAPPRMVFRDPVFAHSRERVVSLCQEIRRRGIRIPWECESRPEHFDAELVRLMAQSGCHCLKIGLESADPQVLVNVRRVNTVDEGNRYLAQVRQLVKVCAEIGVLCRVFVMPGLPGSNVASAEKTAAFLRDVAPPAIHVRVFDVYPGTALEGAARAQSWAEQATILGAAAMEAEKVARQGKPSWQGRLRRVLRR